MYRARALSVAVLIVFYGAVGARQPAVRVAIPLPAPAATIAEAAALPPSDAATLLLNLTRVLYDVQNGERNETVARRAAAREVLLAPQTAPADRAPLPLDPSIWRDTILQQPVPDDKVIGTIMGDRRAALLYYGLSALDDETLAWLGPDRATLEHLGEHPGMFAAFGRSLRVESARIAVPGGADAEPLWAALVGVHPAKAAAFVQQLFRGNGRQAFFYDTLAHLDPGRQRLALGLQLPEAARGERFVALFDSFANGTDAWDIEDHPFSRPAFDAAVMLAALRVTPEGDLAGPRSRRLWERVFMGDEIADAPFSDVDASAIPRDDPGHVDAAWLAARIAKVPNSLGRRRLDVFLFAQRVFGDAAASEPAVLATALRGVEAFPALTQTLERLGISQPGMYVDAARTAEMLTRIRRESTRRVAMLGFQSALGIVERAHRAGGLEPAAARALAGQLTGLHLGGERGIFPRLSQWLHTEFVTAFPGVGAEEATDPLETAVRSALAGITAGRRAQPLVEWEERMYRVDPPRAEARRLGQVRERQGGQTLDQAVADVRAAAADSEGAPDNAAAEQALAETLASVLYAAHLGDPDTQAVSSGNVALRHDFGFAAPPRSARSSTAWRLPVEEFGSKGWHIRGSLLGLEAALGRLSLRRLDPTTMPEEPGLGPSDTRALTTAAALFHHRAMTDAAKDEIAAAIGRGRARAAALTPDPAVLDRAASDAGMSEWRRQTLAWTVAEEPGRTIEHFSLVELFWLGAPRPSLLQTMDAWGAAAHPLSGCLCLRMPHALAAEELSGRPSTGLMATRYADVALHVAGALASLELPAALAPAIMSFALQDAIERTRPAFPGDPTAFARAAISLPRDRMEDYIAALTAQGPLLPADPTSAGR